MSSPVKPKSTPSKEKAPKGTPKGAPRKEKLFAGLTTTENNLIILANYYLESEGGKVVYPLHPCITSVLTRHLLDRLESRRRTGRREV
jgi:hypothetical protein